MAAAAGTETLPASAPSPIAVSVRRIIALLTPACASSPAREWFRIAAIPLIATQQRQFISIASLSWCSPSIVRHWPYHPRLPSMIWPEAATRR